MLTYNGGTAGGTIAAYVIDPDGTTLSGPYAFTNGGTATLTFTPSSGQAGTETVVVYPYSPATTIGSFKIAYTST